MKIFARSPFSNLSKDLTIMIFVVDILLFSFAFLLLNDRAEGIEIYRLLQAFAVSFIPMIFFSYCLLQKKQWIWYTLLILLSLIAITQILSILHYLFKIDFSLQLLLLAPRRFIAPLTVLMVGLFTFFYFIRKKIRLLFKKEIKITEKESAPEIYDTKNLKLATPWSRLFAVIIDAVITTAPGWIIFLIIFSSIIYIPYRPNMHGTPLFPIIPIILGIVFYIIIGILHIMLMVYRSQSIGKYLMNIFPIDIEKNKRIGFWKYLFVREIFGKTLIIGLFIGFNNISEVLFSIGTFIWIPYFIIDNLLIFRKNRMTIHDKISNTQIFCTPIEQKRKGIFDFRKL